ncbi:DUF3141 domain-containing protein [Burkholderiaceae bacterium DAT-1]|nr:DUF3141 domain-containing protein [Burkholderiaceae bacterium DAT-1]
MSDRTSGFPFSGMPWMPPFQMNKGAELLTQMAPFWSAPMAYQQYAQDFWERTVLFLDVLRQRGNQFEAGAEKAALNVLGFEYEIIVDGRQLPRPVNYGLMRIKPRPTDVIEPQRRPFIVFDPRAGHGPGIGGMKHDSQIGMALSAGHPCYFVGFMVDPMPGQTVEDVCRAEIAFIEKVKELHADADGKPCLIGNCQAGWQIMMANAMQPDLSGPIILSGAPLSYWAGYRGKNPMRYHGGMLGGTWLTALANDLGGGKFDGAMLVQNFEGLNPANTFFKKNYELFSKIDTEDQRYLDFEKWWGNPVLLNGEEIQYITDELFVGNKLSSGELITSDGIRVDLRNITSPVVVFCSMGDNITPPPQALGWILDVYGSDKELLETGRTIIYTLHDTIGHLGIFVSAKVATKHHDGFARNIDLIDVLSPGLYELVIQERTDDTVNADLVSSNYVARFERRKLADLRPLVENLPEDDDRFNAVSRLSRVNNALYKQFLRPWVKVLGTTATAELNRKNSAHRVRYSLFSDRNPWMRSIAEQAKVIRENRHQVNEDNPFLKMQEGLADQVVEGLNAWRDARDHATEQWFMRTFGNPVLQAWLGMDAGEGNKRRRMGRDLLREAESARAREWVASHIETGGLGAAGTRCILYAGLLDRAFDARAFALIRQLRHNYPSLSVMGAREFKQLLHDQTVVLAYNQEAALKAIPHMLDEAGVDRAEFLSHIEAIVRADGKPHPEDEQKLVHLKEIVLGAQGAGQVKVVSASKPAPVKAAGAKPVAAKAATAKPATKKPAAPRKVATKVEKVVTETVQPVVAASPVAASAELVKPARAPRAKKAPAA